MKKAIAKQDINDKMRAAYRREDLGTLVRGKYAVAYAKATNVVVIDPKLSKVFPNSEAVNDALRRLVDTTEKSAKAAVKLKKSA
jgi:hypothetical protein